MSRAAAIGAALLFVFGLALVFALRASGARGEASSEPIDARAEPIQSALTPEELRAPSPFRHEGIVANAQARYRIAARVLSRERYYFGWSSDIAPLDLALGWGTMSDPAVDDFVDFEQGMRWYMFEYESDSPYQKEAIAQHSANVHIVPATKNLRRALLALDEGDFVRIDGYLSNIQGPDGEQWATSLSRSDRGNGSCELLVVTELLTDGKLYR